MNGHEAGPGVRAAGRHGSVELVHHLLAEAAERAGDAEALVAGQTRLSFAELDRLTTSLANALRQAGLQRGERVAIAFPRKCLEEVLAILAVSRAGGVFVTVNPMLMPRQVAYILNDCGVGTLITDPSGPQRLAEALAAAPAVQRVVARGIAAAAGPWAALDLDAALACSADAPAGDAVISRDLAAIIFTSGSTGGPKGVMLSHANVVGSARLGSSYLGNRPGDRILSVLPFSFDYGLFQLTSALLHLATLVLAPFSLPGQLVELLDSERITGLGGVPTLWSLLTQPQSPLRRRQLPHLRYVTNSGAALPGTVLRALREALPDTRVFLMYGMTEAFRTSFLDPDEIDRRPNSIGKPLPDTEVHIVGDNGEPCAAGQIGELVHRGSLVSLGYWGKPEATARVFRPPPFAAPELRHAETVFYSGDLVWRDADGFLYYVGRRDAQLKCSGYRVSPSDVEEILYESGWVREAAIVGVPDELAGHVICAFVAPRDGLAVAPTSLIDFCAERLPRYMVPRWVDVLPDLPKTGSGKVDYPALRAMHPPTAAP